MAFDTRKTRGERLRGVNVVGREALAEAEGTQAFGDFYHRAMTVSWPLFFATSAAVFLALNSCFALAYAVGDDPIANARPGSFLDLFFFSVETLATVGFGDMHPQTTYAHVVTTVEIFAGMCFLALMTGLIFTRFARPKARLVFARNPVVSQHDGQPTLMIRVANARINMISDAAAQLWLVRRERSQEGEIFRRFHRLPLIRDANPVFVMSWTLMHAIDPSSPVYGQSAEQLAASETSFVLVLSGHDETSAQELRARQAFDARQLCWGHRYADIIGTDETGAVRIDYAKFHDVEPEAGGAR